MPFCSTEGGEEDQMSSEVKVKGFGVLQCFKRGFLPPALLTFWAGSIFALVGCPVRCRIFNSIPELNPLGARSIPTTPTSQVVTTKNVSRCCQVSAEVQSHTRLRATALEPNKDFVIPSGSLLYKTPLALC